MAHVKLGLHAVKEGMNRIPDQALDQALENIPYFGRKYYKEDEQSKARRNRKSQEAASDDSSDVSNEFLDQSKAERGERRPRHRRNRSSQTRSRRSRDDRDRDYDSEPQPYGEKPYFPPPPTQPTNAQPFLPRAYNPDEYGEQPGSRDQYYAGHPLEKRPFIPPPPPLSGSPGASQAGDGQSQSNGQAYDADRRSSIADRYRPGHYPPKSDYLAPPSYNGSRNASPSNQALALRARSQDGYRPVSYQQGYGQPTYEPPQYGDDEDRSDRSRSRDSRVRRSTADNYGERAKDEFNRHKKDLGGAALGALAGSIIGNSLSKKNSKKGMIFGAALGGIGGVLLERQHEKGKAQKLERRSSSWSGQQENYRSS
jgi:YMGG-like Gly-zipper